jgi:hypothetical protein
MNRRTRYLVMAIAVLLGTIAGPLEHASAAPLQPEPADQLLAIVSPLAAPVCATVGTTTFLVPVVGGLVDDQLAIEGLDVGDTLLDLLGPLFVVCGNLPGAKGTRCELDTQIAGLFPPELASLLPSPAVLGSVVEGAGNLLETLGLPRDPLGLGSALKCDLPQGETAPAAPAAPPAPLGPITTPGGTAFPAPLPPGSAPSLPAATTGSPAGAGSQRAMLLSRIVHDVPGYFTTVQLVLVAILALYLGFSWVTSARLARRRTGS